MEKAVAKLVQDGSQGGGRRVFADTQDDDMMGPWGGAAASAQPGFASTASPADQEGDAVAAELSALRRRMDAAEMDSNASKRLHEDSRRVIKELHRGQQSQGAETGSFSSAGLEFRFKTLERELVELRAQMRMTGVTFGDFTFDSPTDVLAWMTQHQVLDCVHLFTDPMSLLSMADTVAEDEEAATKSRLAASKANDSCVNQTRYQASFYLEVPPLLGKKGNPTDVTKDKALAAVPDYKTWSTGSGADGVNDRLWKLVKEGEKSLGFIMRNQLGGDALRLAQQMLAASKNGWDEIRLWMTSYFLELGQRSSGDEKERWVLVTSCIRTILFEVRGARLPGRSGRPQDMLWGALRAHVFFQALIENTIPGHPKVSVILHQHLVDHATSISAFKKLEVVVNSLKQQVAQNASAADRNASKKGAQQKVS